MALGTGSRATLALAAVIAAAGCEGIPVDSDPFNIPPDYGELKVEHLADINDKTKVVGAAVILSDIGNIYWMDTRCNLFKVQVIDRFGSRNTIIDMLDGTAFLGGYDFCATVAYNDIFPEDIRIHFLEPLSAGELARLQEGKTGLPRLGISAQAAASTMQPEITVEDVLLALEPAPAGEARLEERVEIAPQPSEGKDYNIPAPLAERDPVQESIDKAIRDLSEMNVSRATYERVKGFVEQLQPNYKEGTLDTEQAEVYTKFINRYLNEKAMVFMGLIGESDEAIRVVGDERANKFSIGLHSPDLPIDYRQVSEFFTDEQKIELILKGMYGSFQRPQDLSQLVKGDKPQAQKILAKAGYQLLVGYPTSDLFNGKFGDKEVMESGVYFFAIIPNGKTN